MAEFVNVFSCQYILLHNIHVYVYSVKDCINYVDYNQSVSNELQKLVEEINTTVLSNKRRRKTVSDWTERIQHMDDNWEAIRHVLFEYITVGAAPPVTRVCDSAYLWLSLWISSMLAYQFLPIFRSLKSHNFLIVSCNSTKLGTSFVKWKVNISCKVHWNWWNC